MALEGTLRVFSLNDIFQVLGFQRKSGVLTVEGEEDTVAISFLSGQIVSADSSARRLEDRIGSLMVRAGRVSEEDLARVIEMQKQTHQRLGFLLIREGLVTPEDLRAALRLQILRIVFSAFRWTDGKFRFNQQSPVYYDTDHMAPVPTESVLMEAAQIQDEWPLLQKRIRSTEAVFRRALGVSPSKATRLARKLFFEYGRATIDIWRLRSDSFVPLITTFAEDAKILRTVRKESRGFLLVTGHVGNWEMGAVTLNLHGLTPAVVGQPELDSDVQEMRLKLRSRLGVESIDIGSSMGTAFKVREAIERGRAVALLVDRAYPEDQVIVPFFGRPTPFLRSPALLARFADCPILPGFFLRAADGSYFNVWGAPLMAEPSLSPEEDARRIMSQVAADLEGVIRRHPTQWFNFYRFWGDEV
jgi:KDO2-lipid IV(A) lauroyltransferase